MDKILVETSARHIHLTREALDILCGKDYDLVPKKMLSQPGQYASTLKLDLIGPKKTISGVSVLGGLRSECQVEVSFTDARVLGVSAPVRESGDIKGSAPITIINPANGNAIKLEEGLIIAKRHIHMTPADAANFDVKNGDIVKVRVLTSERKTIFDDVVVRVKDRFALAMHIDTDEANASCAFGEVFGEIVK